MCLSRFTGWRGIFHSVTPLMQLSFSCIVTLCNELLLYSLSFWRVSFQNSISTILTVGNYMQISDAFSDRGCFLEWNPLFRFVAHKGQKWFKNNKYPWFEKQFISGCFCRSIISIRLHFWSQLVYLVCLNMQRRRRGTCDIPPFYVSEAQFNRLSFFAAYSFSLASLAERAENRDSFIWSAPV